MGRITSGVGLVSGINSKDIIDQLIQLESQPKTLLQSRIQGVNQQKQAYSDVATALSALRDNGTTLKRASTFQAATATSSDENSATANVSAGAAVGSYQLQVARLVTTQQVVSRGFADYQNTKLQAGTITIGQGGGELTRQNALSELNGGAGVRRGVFRITDRSGASATIDTTAAVTLADVVKKINTSLDITVKASLQGDHLLLTDQSGATTSNLIVTDLADGHAASDLGLVGNSSTGSIAGTDINYLGLNTSLASLNDGRGVSTLGATTTPDFAVTTGDGSTTDVSIATAKTIGEALTAINTAGGTKFKAELTAGGNGIKLTDTSGGGGAFSVADSTGSTTAHDLGFDAAATGSTINGGDLASPLGTVLLTSLKGGAGLTLGQIAIKSRADTASTTIDLSAARTAQDVVDTINNASLGVTAAINASGAGFSITDSSGGTGPLQIDDAGGGTTATDLGLQGSFDTSITTVNGANLHRQYISANTLLADYNGGKGVVAGSFKITSAEGKTATISISSNQVTLGDVLKQINGRVTGVTASINADGNGILISDASTGAGHLKIEDVDNGTAAQLNIKATATGTDTTIDGALQKDVDVTANDTLATLQTKINNANFGVTASIINDGTGQTPFRLSLTAKNSGRDGRVLVDAGTTGLGTSTLVDAQDAAVFLGGAGSEQPLLITASTNQISGAIKGATISLNGVSDKPVSIDISRTPDTVIDQVKQFADGFNALVDKITELTKYDTETNTPGLLLGDSTIQTVQTQIYAAFSTVVSGNGKYRALSDIGLTIGDGAKLTFDEDRFRAAFAESPDEVSNLFVSKQADITETTSLSSLNEGKGITPIGGGTPDIRFITRSNVHIDVSLDGAQTIGDVINLINGAGIVGGAAKITAKIGSNGNLEITDQTSGGQESRFSASNFNNSPVLRELGLSLPASADGVLTGRNVGALVSKTALGIGTAIEQNLDALINPVDGTITQETNTLDSRTRQFQDRIDTLDVIIQKKRERLERQFSNMESVLAGLQSQQQALNSFKPVAAA